MAAEPAPETVTLRRDQAQAIYNYLMQYKAQDVFGALLWLREALAQKDIAAMARAADEKMYAASRAANPHHVYVDEEKD